MNLNTNFLSYVVRCPDRDTYMPSEVCTTRATHQRNTKRLPVLAHMVVKDVYTWIYVWRKAYFWRIYVVWHTFGVKRASHTGRRRPGHSTDGNTKLSKTGRCSLIVLAYLVVIHRYMDLYINPTVELCIHGSVHKSITYIYIYRYIC